MEKTVARIAFSRYLLIKWDWRLLGSGGVAEANQAYTYLSLRISRIVHEYVVDYFKRFSKMFSRFFGIFLCLTREQGY